MCMLYGVGPGRAAVARWRLSHRPSGGRNGVSRYFVGEIAPNSAGLHSRTGYTRGPERQGTLAARAPRYSPLRAGSRAQTPSRRLGETGVPLPFSMKSCAADSRCPSEFTRLPSSEDLSHRQVRNTSLLRRLLAVTAGGREGIGVGRLSSPVSSRRDVVSRGPCLRSRLC